VARVPGRDPHAVAAGTRRARARSVPSFRRATSYAGAPPRKAKPPLRPLAPPATSRAS
jgi:hypothetical protein